MEKIAKRLRQGNDKIELEGKERDRNVLTQTLRNTFMVKGRG